MVKAYVLIAIEGVEPSIVAKELNDIDEVESVHIIFGEYDIITLVKADDLIRLKEATLEKIAKIKGVIKTSSLIVAD